jgi:hypothetical protein
MFAHPLTPEDLALTVDQDDADIRAVSVFIKHGGVMVWPRAQKNWS